MLNPIHFPKEIKPLVTACKPSTTLSLQTRKRSQYHHGMYSAIQTDNRRQFEPSSLAGTEEQVILLIVAQDELRAMLFQLLLAQGYTVIAVATAVEAIAVTKSNNIILVLLHFATVTAVYGGWEAYTQLCTELSAPVIALPHCAGDYILPAVDGVQEPVLAFEQTPSLQNYLQCIKLLLHVYT